MSAMVLSGRPALVWPVIGKIHADRTLAIGITIALHGFLAAMLLLNWRSEPPKLVPLNSIKVSMIAIAPPASNAMSVVSASAAPMQTQKVPQPAPAVAESAADLAQKYVDKRVEKRVEKKSDQMPREELPKPSANDHAEQRNDEMQKQVAKRDADARAADEQRQRDAHAEAGRQEVARQAASRQYLPIDKKAPAYPQRALDQGIEGTCTVSYTVNTAGRVEQPQVAGDCNPLFIRPSLEAAKGFRYEPRIVDGKAVVVPNVKNTFQYRIEQHASSSSN